MQRSLLSVGLTLTLAALLPAAAGAQTDPALETRIASEAAALRAERAAYPALFSAAYKAYPTDSSERCMLLSRKVVASLRSSLFHSSRYALVR